MDRVGATKAQESSPLSVELETQPYSQEAGRLDMVPTSPEILSPNGPVLWNYPLYSDSVEATRMRGRIDAGTKRLSTTSKARCRESSKEFITTVLGKETSRKNGGQRAKRRNSNHSSIGYCLLRVHHVPGASQPHAGNTKTSALLPIRKLRNLNEFKLKNSNLRSLAGKWQS